MAMWSFTAKTRCEAAQTALRVSSAPAESPLLKERSIAARDFLEPCVEAEYPHDLGAFRRCIGEPWKIEDGSETIVLPSCRGGSVPGSSRQNFETQGFDQVDVGAEVPCPSTLSTSPLIVVITTWHLDSWGLPGPSASLIS